MAIQLGLVAADAELIDTPNGTTAAIAANVTLRAPRLPRAGLFSDTATHAPMDSFQTDL
jgi:hypothetical protein